MKIHLLSLVIGLVPLCANGRLLHFPIAGRDVVASSQRRALEAAVVDQDNVYQARGVQYVDLQVGCPQQTQSAIISTASSAIGFPCSGCTNDCGEGSHLHGLYHEKQSTCFSEVPCDNCTLRGAFSCNDQNQCPVHMSYVEGSSWSGREVEDMVSVGGEDADEEAFPLRFGCQTDITGLFEDQLPDGIFGMSKHSGSALMQWGKLGYLDAPAFSLCYNVRRDFEKQSGVMILGGTDTRLHDKPMKFAKDVGTEEFKVRIKDLHVKRGPSAAQSLSSGESGDAHSKSLGLDGTDTAVIDSATTCTYLNRSWKQKLKTAWDEMTNGKYDIFSDLQITEDQLDELPTLVFELEGANGNGTIRVEYPPMHYMEKYTYGGYDFCMFGDSMGGPVTLGNTFLSGHDVYHDVDNKRIGFAESTCELHLVMEPPTDSDAGVLNDGGNDASSQTNPPRVVPNKPILLQPKPFQIRDEIEESPWNGVLYGMLASGGVAALAIFTVYCCGRGKDASDKSNFWAAPTTKHAFQLSWISLLITLIAIIVGVVLYVVTGFALFLVLGLGNVVDFLSSAVVLWRFFAPSVVTEEIEAKLKFREQRASVAISMTLVVLGLSAWFTAVDGFFEGQQEPEEQTAALSIAVVSFFLFGVLTVFKFRYAKALNSSSLYKDGICSAVGTVLSCSLFVNTIIIVETPSAWWIDPAVAFVCGLVALVYGCWTLHLSRTKDGLPIFSVKWWFLSHGDAGGAANGNQSLELSESSPGEMA